MIALGIFAFIFIPLVIIIGIAASTISFTSWSLIIPLLFGAFGFSIYDTIFFAIVIDLINGIILTYSYGKIKQVDYKLALLSSIPMLLGALIGFFFLEEQFITDLSSSKSGIGYLVILISLIFILKGRRDSKIELNEDLSNKIPLTLKLSQTFKNSFIPIKLLKKTSIFLLIIGIFISGILGGAMGIGSGMNYSLLFMIFLDLELRRATGTSSLMMAIVMFLALFLFMPLANLSLIWPYLLIGSVFAIIGTFLGLKYTLKLSQVKTNYMVGGALFVAGTIAIIQVIII